MSIINKLFNIAECAVKVAQYAKSEFTKPESHRVGEELERYIREFIFPPEFYDLLEKTHSYNTNKSDFVKSSLKPDFTFLDKYSKKEFYVEVKFRSKLFNGKFEWCNIDQLKRYKEYDKQKPVFIALGTPDNVYLIPLSKIKYTGLFPGFVEQFSINPNSKIYSKKLWSL